MCIRDRKLPLQLVFVLINEEYYTDRSTNMKAIAINVALCYVLEKISDLKSLDHVDCNLFSILLTNVLYLIDSPTVHFQILQKVLYGFIVAVSVNYALSFPLRYASTYLRSLILFSSFSLIFPLTVTRILTIDRKKPLTWLYEYIFSSDTRIKIIFIWLLCLLVLIPNVMIFKSNFSLNTSRKIWHFLILFLLIPPLQLDPEFVKVSLSGTVVLFLVVEYLRYLKLEPVGKFLDEKLRSFSDFRDDRGPIIISYIYLIIGVSAPILINGSLVGVISLGVGDSLASIVGGKWGRIKWPGTNKTVEGTLVFILATSAVSLFCQHRYNSFSPISNGNVVLTLSLIHIDVYKRQVPYVVKQKFPIAPNYSAPKGSMLIPTLYPALHDPEVYENPDEFIPERWVEGSPANQAKRNWLVFGSGPHVCLGQTYVMMTFTALIGKFAMYTDFEHKVTPLSEKIKVFATIFPKDDLLLSFKKRDPLTGENII